MNQWRRNRIFWALAAALVVIGVLLFRGDKSPDSPENQGDAAAVSADEISVAGVIACLPYRSPKPGQGCVKALKGDDGKMYALNSAAVRSIENALSEGAKVTAVGEFQSANTSVDDSSVFVYDGVLVLSSLSPR